MRRACTFGIAFVLATATMGFAASPSGADAPLQQGWWMATNPGGLPSAPAQPAAPDVPADGLLIEGGASQTSPTAYAALIYDIPKGATVGSLTLTVAPNSGTTPQTSIQVCPLQNPSIKAEQGGPIADAPAYSTQDCVTAGPSADAATYTFNVAGLVADGSVAVAILPTTPTDRVVLSKPADDSLQVRPAPSSSSSASGPSQVGSSGSGAVGATSSGSSDAFSGGSSLGSSSALPAPSGAAVAAAPAARAPSVAAAPAAPTPQVAASPAGTGTSTRSNFVPLAARPPGPSAAKPWAIAVLVAGALVGAIMWTAAGRAARGGALLREPVQS